MKAAITRLLLLCAIIPIGASAQSVHISGMDVGQGILRQVGAECFVITPAHVVSSGTRFELRGEGLARADSEPVTTFADDLAALHVLTSNLNCLPWKPIERFADFIRSKSEGVVQTVNPDGSLSRRFVRLVDFDSRYMRVRPIGAEDALFQGLSGSGVLIDGQLIGVLQSVESDSGHGHVLVLPYIEDLTRQFFSTSPAPDNLAAVTTSDLVVDHPAGKSVGSEWKFHDARVKATTLPDRLAANVDLATLTDTRAKTFASFPAFALPIGVDVEIASKTNFTVGAIVIKFAEGADTRNFAKKIDIVAIDAANTLKSLATLDLKRSTAYQIFPIPKTTARTMRLVLRENWGGTEIGIAEIALAIN